jgi:hypothetical protein
VTRSQAAAAAAALGLGAQADGSSQPLLTAGKRSQHAEGLKVMLYGPAVRCMHAAAFKSCKRPEQYMHHGG